MEGVEARVRMRVLVLVGCAAALTLVGCGQGVSAEQALGDEPLAFGPIDGVEVIDEAVIDGSAGGLLGKPSYPTVTRHLLPQEERSLAEVASDLVDRSLAQGWQPSGALSDRPYRATKTLPEGPAQLVISIHEENPPARVVLTMRVT